MERKPFDSPDELSCCERRAMLRGLGAAGLLMLGRCTTSGGGGPRLDQGHVAANEGLVAADKGTLLDSSFVGADGGLPPIDLAVPPVTETATFALG